MKEGLFYPVNNEFDKKFSALKNSFRSRMNGETAQQMKKRGITYRLNYGIATPHIKEIAKAYSFSPSECERLWFMEIREAMLLAAMQMPQEELTPQRMMRWSSMIKNSDIAEQAAFFLFSRMEHADAFLADCLQQSNSLLASTAFFTAGRRLQLGSTLSNESMTNLLQIVEKPEQLTDNLLLRGISLFLRQGLRCNRITPITIRKLIIWFNEMTSLGHKQLAEELTAELLYLEL